MTSLLAILALGFFLGMRHATDPDHVIAVSTIVARQRQAGGAALIGALWGVGHSLTILLVGGGIILFRWVIPPRVGLSMEFAVGLMLILLGIMNLKGILGTIGERTPAPPGDHPEPEAQHSHPHGHGDYIHSHRHGHDPESHPHRPEQTPISWLDHHLSALGLYQSLRPLVVGAIHGLAGSAAVALLVLTTIGDPAWSAFYLVIFGAGTIVGMMLITAVVAWPLQHAATGFARWNWRLRIASGVLSLGFGLLIAYQMGIVHGLFTGQPAWTPR